MALTLIHGPPNSGRAGLVLRALREALDSSPVLVVPTFDDVDSFERELCAEGAVLGATVTTFDDLFEIVAAAAGQPPPAVLSAAQRRRVVEVAISEARDRLAPLRRSATRPGFAASLDRLLSEMQAAGTRPARVEAGADTLEGSAYLGDLAALFASYEEVRERIGAVDAHGVAERALVGLADAEAGWERPVFVYGFDDLSGQQLELLRRLAATAKVTVSLPREDGRDDLDVSRTLLDRLRGEIGVDEEIATAADPGNTPAALLFALERGFGVAAAEPVEPTGGLTLLRSAGARGEAEAIAALIAGKLHRGARPEEIAIVFRDPARRGPLLGRVLDAYGVPAALEAKIPIASSGVGGALLALLEAEHGTRRAADALRWLRGPSGVRPGKVDWLERAVRVSRARTAEEVWDLWSKRWGELPEDLVRLRRAEASPASALAEIAAGFLAREAETAATAELLAERQAAATLKAAMTELSELGDLAPGPAETIAFLRALEFRAWSGSIDGRVRIASPERLRAGRFDHVVIGSLQDGEFPRRGAADSFLSEAQRESLGLDPRRDDDANERYLFYASLSRARESLTLSYRDSDENGAAEARSPFLDEVRRLLSPPAPAEATDPLEVEIGGGRGLAEPVFRPVGAPSEDELARAVAAAGTGGAASLDAAEPPAGMRERVEARLEAARAAAEASRAPGPLSSSEVLADLRAVPAYGGTTLEEFDRCSYRWFVDHELSPQPLEPMPDGIVQGGLMHEVLERLYGERPGGSPVPLPDTLDDWVDRGRSLVRRVSAERQLGDHPAERAMRRGVEELLTRFLGEEARRDMGEFAPWRLEASFGEGEGSERPPLEIDGWKLHGAIDRLDRDAGGRAFVHDYKVASRVSPASRLEEDARLQLQLYLLAAQRLWGLEPAGALYHPLRGTSERRPRGLVLDETVEDLPSYPLVGTDLLDSDEFDAALAEARDRAGRIVARMRDGDIRRDPGPRPGLRNHDVCPRFCDFAPICRRDRPPVVEDDQEAEER